MVGKFILNPSRTYTYLGKRFFLQGSIAALSWNISPVVHCSTRQSTTFIRKKSFSLKACAKARYVKVSANTSATSQTVRNSSSCVTQENQPRLTVVKRSVERMAAARSGGCHGDEALNQNFDYFLVLDFEATCDNETRISPQEVIEFPVLKVNARTHAVDSTFHQYVRPLFNPHLTPFCTELTGIVQEMVDNQKSFPEVMEDFKHWMEAEGLLNPEIKSIFVTCGDWDLKSMLPRQCETSRVPSKSYFGRWINIKKSYADVTRTFPKGMMHMLTGLKLKHVGRHHSGIDDCRNIANIVVELMRQGYAFKENGRLR